MIKVHDATTPADRMRNNVRVRLVRDDGAEREFIFGREVGMRMLADGAMAFRVRETLAVLASMPRRVNFCHAARDGDCIHPDCPQNVPATRQSHCPLDKGCPRCLLSIEDCEC